MTTNNILRDIAYNALASGLASAVPGALAGALRPLEKKESRTEAVLNSALIPGLLGMGAGIGHPGTPGRVLRDAGIGAAIGAIPGALWGAYGDNDASMSPLRAAAFFGLHGASAGAYTGAYLGPSISPVMRSHTQHHAPGEAPPVRENGPTDPKNIDWLKGVKTKAEAKQRYHAEAMRHHPDRGGDLRKMQDLNTLWNRVQNHPNFQKWACLRGYKAALAQYGC